MQMTGDPSPLLRAPPRGFRDKSRRNYNAFNRHAHSFFEDGVRERGRRESDAVAPGLLQSPALRPPLLEEAAHV